MFEVDTDAAGEEGGDEYLRRLRDNVFVQILPIVSELKLEEKLENLNQYLPT